MGIVKIVIVDDDPMALEMLRIMLSQADVFTGIPLQELEIISVRSGSEALQRVAGMKVLPQLVITDLIMKDMNGVQLIEAIQAQLDPDHTIRMAVITASSEPEVIERARTENWLYIQKPYHGPEMCKSVINFCPEMRQIV